MVYGISSGDFSDMKNSNKNAKKIIMNEFFASSSVLMGGNGKSLTKENLKEFVSKPELYPNNLTESQTNSFKKLYEMWSELYNDKESINSNEFFKAEKLFNSIMNGEDAQKVIEYTQDNNDRRNKNLRYLAEKINGNEDKPLTADKLKNYLGKLIENNDEENNDEEIAFITNVLADMNNPSNEYDA